MSENGIPTPDEADSVEVQGGYHSDSEQDSPVGTEGGYHHDSEEATAVGTEGGYHNDSEDDQPKS